MNPDLVCNDDRIRRHAYLSLRTNYFSNLFLLECAKALESADLDGVRAMIAGQLADWGGMVAGTGQVDVSAIDMQSLLYAGSLTSVGDMPVSFAHFELSESAAATAGRRFLMPYDQSRHERMAVLAAEHRSPA